MRFKNFETDVIILPTCKVTVSIAFLDYLFLFEIFPLYRHGILIYFFKRIKTAESASTIAMVSNIIFRRFFVGILVTQVKQQFPRMTANNIITLSYTIYFIRQNFDQLRVLVQLVPSKSIRTK